MPLADRLDGPAPYFSLILIPGQGTAAMTGSLAIVGLGPRSGALDRCRRPARRIEAATDIVGYQHVSRPHCRIGRVSGGTAATIAPNSTAPVMPWSWRPRGVGSAVVSGGDPGVFAMAAAVFEAIETGEPAWRALDVTVVPGISAMQAAAAGLGAPLGHDFCAISLSDNLKPWEIVERRLRAAADGDFVIALFNPASKARPDRIHEAFALLRGCKAGGHPGCLRARHRPAGRADRADDAGRRRPGDRRHEHAGADRLERNTVHGAAGRSAMAADAANLWGRPMSLDPRAGRHRSVSNAREPLRSPAARS